MSLTAQIRPFGHWLSFKAKKDIASFLPSRSATAFPIIFLLQSFRPSRYSVFIHFYLPPSRFPVFIYLLLATRPPVFFHFRFLYYLGAISALIFPMQGPWCIRQPPMPHLCHTGLVVASARGGAGGGGVFNRGKCASTPSQSPARCACPRAAGHAELQQ